MRNWRVRPHNLAPLALLAALSLAPAWGEELTALTTAEGMARVVKKLPPAYPMAAKQLNVKGTLEVQVTVNAAGNVTDAKALRGNAIFSMNSLAAAKQWKFAPYAKDGAAAGFSTVLIFDFTK